MELRGDTTIYFNEFPDWDEFPPKRESFYSDSRVFEFKVENDTFIFTVKALVETSYGRWYRPADNESPEEDIITNYDFQVECLRGTRYHKIAEVNLPLNEIELLQLEEFLEKNIIIE